MSTTNAERLALVQVRDIIVGDLVAVEKWPRIVDHIGTDSPVDVSRIKCEIKAGNHEEAVLASLLHWRSNDASVDLLNVFRAHGLKKLADEVQKSECWKVLNPDTSSCLRPSFVLNFPPLVHNCIVRGGEVEALHAVISEAQALQLPASSIPMIAICGLGGVGKSTLARLYASKYKSYYNGNLMWIDASTVQSIRASFFKLAAGHGLLPDADVSNEQLASILFAACFNDKKSLCVYDNVQKAADLEEFKPYTDSHRTVVLLTSRQINVVPLMKHRLILGVLSLDEAIQLIQTELHTSTSEKAVVLAEALDRFPLALQQALSYIGDEYIETGNSAIDRYLKEWESNPAKLLKGSQFQKTIVYSETTLTTWNATLEIIRDESATKLINAMAYLNQSSISVAFIRCVFGSDADTGLRSLNACSMIRLIDDKVTMQRLLQLVVRLQLNDNTVLATISPILSAIEEQLLKDEDYTELTKECRSHGLALFPFYAQHFAVVVTLRHLWNVWPAICTHLIQDGHYSESLSLAQDAGSLFRNGQPPEFGTEAESTLRMKWSAAVAHFHLQDYKKAFSFLDSILHAPKAGPELTDDILSMLAQVHSRLGNNVGALKIYCQLIPAGERRLDANHVSVLGYKLNQASVLMSCRPRRLGEALELLRQVYDGYSVSFGSQDIRTLNAKEQMGHVYCRMKEYETAVEIWSAVLESYNALLCEDHPNIARLQKCIRRVNEKMRKSREHS